MALSNQYMEGVFFLIQLFKQHHLKGESEICFVEKRGEFNKSD